MSMNQSDLLNKLNEIQSPNRCASLVNAVGYLLFSEMRLDPVNPQWPGGDRLLFSERYAGIVKDAYQAIGCPARSIPTAGLDSLEACLKNGVPSQRIFCLIDANDSNFVNKNPHVRVTVFSPEPPVDATRWNIQNVDELTIERLDSLLSAHSKNPDKPLWIVAPLTGTLLIDADVSSDLPSLSDRMSRLGTETAFSVLAEVNRLIAQGRDIISFGLGEPDFDTPSHIREAAKRALDQGYTHYGPSNGLPELRQAIAQYMQRTRRIPVDPEEIVVTPGAKPIVFDVMMALLNPGDEVLYPNPGYPIYESVADWIGAHAKPLPLLESQNWNFSVDQLVHSITPKTRMIVINSPGNPTGTLLGESELREIADWMIKYPLQSV
ncbi:MAG: aminotransferase class I/II-fold pyridoxal phosphate-dependent enzyme, partial [Candidatus Hinthialibacter sp.]